MVKPIFDAETIGEPRSFEPFPDDIETLNSEEDV